MGHMRKFLELTNREKAQLFEACALLAFVSSTIRVFKLRHVSRVLHRAARSRRFSAYSRQEDIHDVVVAVSRAASANPLWRRCLHQAMAAEVMLLRRGFDAVMRFGVSRNADKELGFHAWLEYQSSPIGGFLEPGDRYAVLQRDGTGERDSRT